MTSEEKSPVKVKFSRELAEMKDRLMELARLAAEAMEQSLRAFQERDAVLARQVIDGDKALNSLEEIIDGECISLIALFQPVAIELRQVMAVDHII
ncbi:MAG: PhoU domain-containing protein, partial [Desulfobaccales bacterium]